MILLISFHLRDVHPGSAGWGGIGADVYILEFTKRSMRVHGILSVSDVSTASAKQHGDVADGKGDLRESVMNTLNRCFWKMICLQDILVRLPRTTFPPRDDFMIPEAYGSNVRSLVAHVLPASDTIPSDHNSF